MSPSPTDLASTSLQKLTTKYEATKAAVDTAGALLPEVVSMGQVIVDSLRQGGTLLTAGNGGSAAQALHLTEELIGRYNMDRDPIRSISLVTDPSALTCIANDFGFESIFERPLRGLGRRGDVLLVMSTSGESDNIVRALHAAGETGVVPMALLGRDGGRCRELCDQAIIAPGDDSATIQDVHQVIIHLLCELIEASVLQD